MASFVVNGTAYNSSVITGRKQVHVLRRLTVLFAAFTAAKPQIDAALPDADPETGEEKGTVDLALVGQALLPVANTMLNMMSDADTDFVLDACMDVTERRNAIGGAWAPVRAGGVIMDRSDEALNVQMVIAWNVISETFQHIIPSLAFDPMAVMQARA